MAGRFDRCNDRSHAHVLLVLVHVLATVVLERSPDIRPNPAGIPRNDRGRARKTLTQRSDRAMAPGHQGMLAKVPCAGNGQKFATLGGFEARRAL